MDLVFNAVIPVFAIVLLGYLAGRFKILPKDASAVLTRFIFYISLPILFFITFATAKLSDILYWPYIGAFAVAMFATYIINVLYSTWVHKDPVHRYMVRGLSVASPNVSFMGIPIMALLMGRPGVIAATVAAILTVVLMVVSIFFIELCHSKREGNTSLEKLVFKTLFTNPLFLGALCGFLYSLTGFAVARPVQLFCSQLASTVGPCALFAVGLSLLGEKVAVSDAHELLISTVIKLFIQPALMLALIFAFHVDGQWAVAGLILSALPSGAFAFIVAQRYKTFIKESSALIVVTTILSVLTLTGVILLCQHFWPSVTAYLH